VEIQDWGLIDYEVALAKQQALVEEVISRRPHSKSSGVLVFCSHPPVVTKGRKTQPSDIFSWKGPVVEVNRGGRATYHGPSQLVIYPILDLEKFEPVKDVVALLRKLESATVQTLASYNILGRGKTDAEPKDLEDTGVWVKDQKIASLGIAVRQWVSFHGLAVNLKKDPMAFQGLNPCGYKASVMTSLEDLLGTEPDRMGFQKKFTEYFCS